MTASSEQQHNNVSFIGYSTFDWYLIAVALILALLATYYIGFYRGDYARFADNREPIATILTTSNTVKTKIAGLPIWEKADENEKLADQDQIFTDQESDAKVDLEGVGHIDISENSLVVIQSGKDGTSLDVLQGIIFVTLTGGNKAVSVKVHNTVTNLTSKDSRVQFRAEKNNKASIIVIGGAANLAGKDRAVNVGKNQIVSVDSDGTIIFVEDVPAELIEPANRSVFFISGTEKNVAFNWEPAAGSKSFRLEISHENQFNSPEYSAETENVNFKQKELGKGKYFWRVGSLASTGDYLYGEVREFQIAENSAPKLLTPADNRNFKLKSGDQSPPDAVANVTFEWSSELRNSGFIVEIFHDSTAKDHLIKSVTTRDTRIQYAFPAGTYYWRVAADTDLENYSKVGVFSVGTPVLPQTEKQPPLEAPLLDDQYDIDVDEGESESFIQPILDFLFPTAYAAESDSEGRKYVSWPPVKGAVGYQVEIAKDQLFSNIFISARVDEPKLKWPKQASGKYFMRVHGIDGAGVLGSASNIAIVYASQRIPIATVDPLLAPTPIRPFNNEIFRPSREGVAQVRFIWESLSKKSEYELQVAKDPLFNNLVVSRQNLSDTLVSTIVGPGKYYHRVRSVRADAASAFSKPAVFVVLQVPPTITKPGTNAKVLVDKEDKLVNIKWRSTSRITEKYVLEVSKDRAFKKDVDKYSNKDEQMNLDLKGGTYYARVKMVGNDVNSSDYSRPIRFTVEAAEAPVIVKKAPRVWRPLSPFLYAGYYPSFVEYQLGRGPINKTFSGQYATSFKVALGMDIGATQTEATYRFKETIFVGSEKTGESYTDLETKKQHDEFGVIFRRKFGTPDSAVVWMPEIGYSKRQIELFNINSDNALSFQTVTTRGLMAGLTSIILISDDVTASLTANYTSLSKFSHTENSDGISNEIVGNSNATTGQVGFNWSISHLISIFPAINVEQIQYSLENNVDQENTDIKITEVGVFLGGGFAF